MLRSICLAVALLAAAAAPSDAAPNRPTTADKELAFENECILLGGKFKRDATTGTLACLFPDGGTKLCDRGVKNCKYFPAGRVVVKPRLDFDPSPQVLAR